MLAIKPRPYQEEALNGIREQLNDNRSTLLVLATGLGKTITAAQAADEFARWGRVMMLAHRAELIYQAQDKIYRVTGHEPEIEMADAHIDQWSAFPPKIIISTIQTQIAGMNGEGRMTKFDPDDFSLLIVDEAHHVPAKSYKKVVRYYQQNPTLKVLGLTATPDRADEKALGQIFETVAYEYGILEGIKDGWLVPIEQKSVYVEGLDYSEIRTTAGDLNGGDLAKVLEFEETMHRIASPVIELTGDRKSLIFAISLAQAERLTEIINRHKPGAAEWVHGGTPKDDRRELFARYKKGDFQYLVNVGVTTEGFDEPSIEVVVMARPTKSRSLYAQMCGRGTRALEGVLDQCEGVEARRLAIASSGKPHLEIIDFVGNAGRHKLITSVDILGGNYDDNVVERAKRNAEKESATGDPVDIIDELEKAEREITEERIRTKRKNIVLRAHYSTATINPFDVLDIDPCREKGWHVGRQPTEKQLAFLEKNGVDVKGLSFTHASQLIGRIIKNREEKLCSYKQAKVLQRFGYDTNDLLFTDASELIDAIAKNQWRRPA